MRWNCPHCGTALGIGDEKISSGWVFSLCYRCGGHSLIRKNGKNIIKVDRAPPGEEVLLPESTEFPLLNREAKEHLERVTQKSPPPFRHSMEFSRNTCQNLPGPIEEVRGGWFLHSLSVPMINFLNRVKKIQIFDKMKAKSSTHYFLTGLIGVAGVFTITSGYYFIKQANAVLEKAQEFKAQKLKANASNMTSLIVDETRQRAMAPVPNLVPNLEGEENGAVDEAEPAVPIRVKLISANISLHSGPGMQYPVVGVGNPAQEYWVTDWRERWYKIIPKDKKDASLAAWVSNDKIQVLSQ